MLTNEMAGWPVELQLRVEEYIREHRMVAENMMRVDLVLVLLRIGDKRPELRQQAQERVCELTGRAIQRLPSAMPPWPPAPVRAPNAAHKPVKIAEVAAENPCSKNTEMHARFSLLKKGMTLEQALMRGVTRRDLRYWERNGRIKLQQSA